MRVLRWATLVIAIAAGYLAAPDRAVAAPMPIAGLATTGSDTNALLSEVRWRRHGGWHRGRHWRRGFYRPRPFYGRRFYRPRVVCRVRYTAWGPRRVCFRRF